MTQQKLKIQLNPIKEIPEEMLVSFQNATDADNSCMRRAINSEVKIGAFHEGNLVGFICGSPWHRVFDVPALYIQSRYRGKGIGTRLIYRITAEAKKRKLEGVYTGQLLWGTKWLLEKEGKKWKSRGAKSPLDIKVIEGDIEMYGEIMFRKRPKMPPRRIK